VAAPAAVAGVSDPYATVATEMAPAAGPVPAAEMTGAVPAAAPESFPHAGMVSAAPINPAGGGEVDKVSIILAVVSFLIVVGMVVVLAMMTVE
jgi:hypothetical protein